MVFGDNAIEIFNCPFRVTNIDELKETELAKLALDNKFKLPEDKKLLHLILNPFYLNEYIVNVISNPEIDDTKNTYDNFKKILWDKKILNSSQRKNNLHIEREKIFIDIAR